MADEIEQARIELAATRQRIDRGLAELAAQVPDRDAVVATAARIGAALGATATAVAGLVVYGRRRSSAKEQASEGRAYAAALVEALPEVAQAWAARQQASTNGSGGPSAPDTASEATSQGSTSLGVTALLLAVGGAAGFAISRRL